MATLLSMTNRILRRLREDTVTNTNDTEYATLIAEFIADSYDEVCEAHPWETFRHKVKVDLVASTDTYDLTRIVSGGGAVRNDTDVAKDDSEIQWIDQNSIAVYMFDDDNDIDSRRLVWTTREIMDRLKNTNRTDTKEDPTYITLYPKVDSGGTTRLYMQLYPIPSAVRTVELSFWTRPTTLEAAGADDAVEIRAAERAVFLLATLYALNERGEEIGEPGNIAEQRYGNALGAAIEKDIAAAQRGDRYDWRRD